MTQLHKAVSRRSVGDHPRWAKPIVVTLMPGDVVAVRLERSTRSFLIPISKLYDYAESCHARALLTGGR